MAQIGNAVRVTWPAFGENAALVCLECVLKERSETTITILEVTRYFDGTRALWNEHVIPKEQIREFKIARFERGE